MGFSLIGFGAGLAESAIERIEEERKFSNLALQGRIERASVLKMQRDKEADALMKELREQKESLQQFGIDDPEVQKAYLTAPTLAEALKKSLESGQVRIENANQYAREFAKINLAKLPTGTVDEFIANAGRAARGGGEVEPARVMPTEGGSIFAPSVSGQQRRLQQLASARGMTLEEVARAESAAAPSRPEVAASINFDVLKREDKTTWKQKLERYETNYADTVQKFGADSPEAVRAKAAVDSYRVTTSNMTEDQLDHAKKLSRAQAIVFDKSMQNVSDQDRQWAQNYLREYDAYKRRQDAAGKDDEKIPAPGSLVSIARTAGANAVRATFGTSAIREQISFTPNQDGSTTVSYTGRDQAAQQRIIRREQEGVVASMRMYMTQDGKVTDRKVEQALSAFGITLDEQRRPVLINAPAAPQAPEGTPGSRLNADVEAATAKPGVRIGRTITPAPAPKPTTEDKFVVGQEYKDKNGNRAKYLGNGQWQPL